MKKLGTIIFCLSWPLVFIACGKKEDKKKDQLTAPANTCLIQNCDNSEYNNYSASGFTRYDTSTWGGLSYIQALTMYGGQANGSWGWFCGCPTGSSPVYNSLRGLGCVNNMHLQGLGSSVIFWTLIQGQQNFSSYSAANALPYIQSNYYNYGYTSTGNCMNFVSEACYTNQPDACRNGYSCRPTVQGSALGICTQ
jgi:hypothetical protein